jgi:hypothetical protein
MTSGLGHTDKGSAKAIGGAAMRFFHDVCSDTGTPPCWDFPPSRAMLLFQRMIAAAPNVTLIPACSVTAVSRDGTSVTYVTLTPLPSPRAHPTPAPALPINISADYFIDASYEGDFIAAAAISTTIGRESQSMYAAWRHAIPRSPPVTRHLQVQRVPRGCPI